MSVQTSTTVPALQVKKTRTSNTSKKDAPPKGSRAKKSTAAAPKSSSKPNSPAQPQPSRAMANKDGDDLDKIVSGIKKITLVTNKQKQARARDAKKTSGTSTPTAVSNVPASPTPQSSLPQDAPHHTNGNETPKASGSKKESETEIRQETPDTPLVDSPDASAAEVTTPTAVAPPVTVQTSTPDNFVHYQANGPIPETVLPPEQPLSWLPVNMGATPSPAKQEKNDGGASITSPSPEKRTPQQPVPQSDPVLMSPSPMKRGDLPVFTPTSHLRFAAPHLGEQKVDEAIWEVPETPQ